MWEGKPGDTLDRQDGPPRSCCGVRWLFCLHHESVGREARLLPDTTRNNASLCLSSGVSSIEASGDVGPVYFPCDNPDVSREQDRDGHISGYVISP